MWKIRKNRKHKNSLMNQINLSFLLIVAIAVVSFMLVSINRSSRTIEDISVNYTRQLIHMVNENINSYIENMDNISQIVTKNSDVRNYLSDSSIESGYAQKVEEQFLTLKETRKDIYNIGILGKNESYLINTRYTEINPNVFWGQLAWYRAASRGDEVITSSHVQNLVYDEYPWVVTLGKSITNPVDGKIIGVFFIDLNYRSISDLAEDVDLGQKGYVYIVDDGGNIVYHPKQQLIYSGLWSEEINAVLESENGSDDGNDWNTWESNGKLYSTTKSDLTGWTVVGVTDMAEMLAQRRELVNLYYLIAVCLIGFAMMLAIVLTDRITLPLRNLQRSMQVVKDGQFQVDIIENSEYEQNEQNEIGDLINSFRIMVKEIEELIARNTKEQEEKRKNELNALQAQIKPHFLYNTLDSIIWMAEGGNTKDTVLMTSALAKLFRKSISNNKELVTLAEEMEYTKSYLTIQKMRYHGQLQYTIDVDPAIADIEIIKLIVQPLVENAIYHGIKYKKGIGTIEIKAEYKNKGILIQIRDDGAGMTQEKLEHILDEQTDKEESVGVLNVHRRIRLYYGQDYGLSFESEIGVGTTAYIYLPDKTGENHEEHEEHE